MLRPRTQLCVIWAVKRLVACTVLASELETSSAGEIVGSSAYRFFLHSSNIVNEHLPRANTTENKSYLWNLLCLVP